MSADVIRMLTCYQTDISDRYVVYFTLLKEANLNFSLFNKVFIKF
jgi:hypothetical protein